MKCTGRKIAVVLACLLVGGLLVPRAGRAEMVQTPVAPRQGENRQQSVERVKKQALQNLILKKTRNLLPGKISEQRQKALLSWLDSRQKEFVRRVEVLDSGDSGDSGTSGGLLVMDVTLDEQALLQLLRLSGVYYTLSKKKPFQLDLQGATPEDKQELDALMVLSGLEPGVDVMPALKLYKEQGVWIGSLDTGYGQFGEQGQSLASLWTELWAHYFASLAPPKKEEAPINAQASAGMLVVRGFSSPDQVYVLDAAMSKWKSQVERAKLQKIDMNPSGIEAVWDVSVFDRQNFSTRLEGYIANSGLVYGWNNMHNNAQ